MDAQFFFLIMASSKVEMTYDFLLHNDDNFVSFNSHLSVLMALNCYFAPLSISCVPITNHTKYGWITKLRVKEANSFRCMKIFNENSGHVSLCFDIKLSNAMVM